MKKENFVYPALIIIAGIAAYSNSFGCSFHFDDFPNIVSNHAIYELSDWKAWMFFNPYRPVVFFTFALNYHFGMLDVFGYHLVNLVIHLVNALLLWKLVRLIFCSPYLEKHALSASAGNIAFFTALLFAVHPLMTESVTYIVQRLVSLASLFCLLSLVLFTKGLLSLRPSRRIGFYAGAGLSAILGFFTKETALTLPLLMLMVYFFFFFRQNESKRFPGLILLTFVFVVPLFFAGAAVWSGKYFNVIPPREGHPYFITPLQYYYTEVNVIFTYLRLIILPVNQTLDYNYPIAVSLLYPHLLIKLAGLIL
ncbi:MAG: tetratricopeptide repeat protein, partial [Bacteroidetes bacterium]|nr:tetratricopeptide repeat protein [Bacteroidota bacterium]